MAAFPRCGEMKLASLLCAALLAGCPGWLWSAATPTVGDESNGKPSPFTVRDSIELTQVRTAPAYAPNKARFVFQTSRGDLSGNVLVQTLMMFETADMEKYLDGKGTRPEPRILARFAATREVGQLSSIQWLNGIEVGFLAEDERGVVQVFVVDTDSGSVGAITKSTSDITSFAAAGDTVLYYAVSAKEPPRPTSIDGISLGELLAADHADYFFPSIDLFVLSRRSGSVKRINSPTVRLQRNYQQIWISPREDYAITFEPATSWPTYWADYKIPRYDTYGFHREGARADPKSWDLANGRVRYRLIDLMTLTGRALLDSPAGDLSFNYA